MQRASSRLSLACVAARGPESWRSVALPSPALAEPVSPGCVFCKGSPRALGAGRARDETEAGSRGGDEKGGKSGRGQYIWRKVCSAQTAGRGEMDSCTAAAGLADRSAMEGENLTGGCSIGPTAAQKKLQQRSDLSAGWMMEGRGAGAPVGFGGQLDPPPPFLFCVCDLFSSFSSLLQILVAFLLVGLESARKVGEGAQHGQRGGRRP